MPAEPLAFVVPANWLPQGKRAAICFSVDDVHPANTADHGYDAGGDLDGGALGRLGWLMRRHPQLKATLFVTADWRSTGASPAYPLLSRTPWLRDRIHLAPRLRRGTMRIGDHPAFVRYLNGLDRVEIALHGLHHCAPGRAMAAEFAGRSPKACAGMLAQMLAILDASGLRYVRGMTPPAWDAGPGLLRAMADAGFAYVAAARDIRTDVYRDARTAMSGLMGLPLFQPCRLIEYGLAHIPVNFQATSDAARADAIVGMGGLVSIKAHIMKDALGHVALDGLDEAYTEYLDGLFAGIEMRFGEAIWWPSFTELAERLLPDKRMAAE